MFWQTAMVSTKQFDIALSSFLIVLVCNVMDVIQNVYSKKLISNRQYTVWSLQLYAAFVALIIQVFVWLASEGYTMLVDGIDPSRIGAVDANFYAIWIMSAGFYYAQLVLAFAVMAEVSALSYSVLNITKRVVAILIAIQVGTKSLEPVHILGIVIAVAGATMYNILKTPELLKYFERLTSSVG